MAYFHAQFPIAKKGRALWSVLGETREEMLSVARGWPEAVLINLPPRGSDSFRSRSLPQLYVDVSREDILYSIGSEIVPLEYIPVLRMMLRQAIFNETHGPTEESEKYFSIEIRGKVIQLLRAGAWVDEPSSLGLQKLNQRIEKLDLGRRSDLKFSSNPIALDRVQKYDQDAKREDLQKEEPWLQSYRQATGSERLRQYRDLDSMPWRQSMIRDIFGEP